MTVETAALVVGTPLFTLTLSVFCLALWITGGVVGRAYSFAPGVAGGIRAWASRRAGFDRRVPETDDWVLGPEARAILRRPQAPKASIEELY